MRKSERILALIRLLITHRDGLKASEIQVILGFKPSAFYNYIAELRRQSFNIQCRRNGTYIIILDEKAEKMLIDYFPKLLLKKERENFSLKNGLKIAFSNIYSVEEKKNGKIHFFMGIPAICIKFPALEKYFIYNHWKDKSDSFQTSQYILKKGKLYTNIEQKWIKAN